MVRLRPLVVVIVALIVAMGSQSVVAVIDGPKTAQVAQESDTRIEQLTPAGVEVTVSPGTDLLFELAVSNPTWDQPEQWWEHTQIKWFVDGERRWSEYPSVSVNPHLTIHNVSSGTHMITGIVLSEDGSQELGTAAWIVHVEEGSNDPPSLERVNPAGERIEVEEGGETRNFTLGANDPEGNLHRILWFAGVCDDPLGASSVEGAEDEATLSYEAGHCGVMGGWVVDERGAMNGGGLDGLTSWDIETVENNETADNGAAAEEWHTLAIDGQGTSSLTDYSFAVSGSLEAGEGLGAGDSIDGSTAEGFVRAGTDSFRFTGELEEIDLVGGDAVASVDGDPVDGSADETWHTITIDGTTSDGRSDYTFTVSGDLEAERGIGAGDTIDGSTAEGFVNGGSDVYRFTGDLSNVDLTGDATVYVDGEEFDDNG